MTSRQRKGQKMAANFGVRHFDQQVLFHMREFTKVARGVSRPLARVAKMTSAFAKATIAFTRARAA